MAVIVKGIPLKELKQTSPLVIKTKKGTMTKNDQIESMERTFQSETEGKWMFIVKEKDRDSVVSFLENKMEELITGTMKITCIGAKA